MNLKSRILALFHAEFNVYMPLLLSSFLITVPGMHHFFNLPTYYFSYAIQGTLLAYLIVAIIQQVRQDELIAQLKRGFLIFAYAVALLLFVVGFFRLVKTNIEINKRVAQLIEEQMSQQINEQ